MERPRRPVPNMGELVDAKTQTNPVSLQTEMERFEKEVKLITSMRENRFEEALRTVTDIMKSNYLQVYEHLKYLVMKIECQLHSLKFGEATIDGEKLVEICTKTLNTSEIEISNIALNCRENNEYIRAMVYYLCSLHCWLRDMRNEKVKRRTIEVITRGEKLALTLYHIGVSDDTKRIVYEYALPEFVKIMTEYETGPQKYEVHRDLSIMGCYYHIGNTLRKLGDLEKCIELTKEGINTGMKSMKEHRNHLLPKSHSQVAECYLELNDFENAKRWFVSALGLCPFITNWDFQSKTELKKEFEKQVNENLRIIKSKSTTTTYI